MDLNIRPRQPFTLRNKNTEQECGFDTRDAVRDFLAADTIDADEWELVNHEAAAAEVDTTAAQYDTLATQAAPEAPAATEEPAATDEAA